MKIKKFTDLETWKESHKLVLLTYTLTKKFPGEEKFGLTNQSRRAVISITSNIAEGFGRKTLKDKQHFYTTSKTSLAELHNQFLAARDLKYISQDDFRKFEIQSLVVDKLIAGLIKSATDYFHGAK